MLAYDFLKAIKKTTKEHATEEHYGLLKLALGSLNKKNTDAKITELWFYMRLLWLEGRAPNVASDTAKQPLDPSKTYNFNYDSMAFELSGSGQYNAGHIKLLRISAAKSPKPLSMVIADEKRLLSAAGLVKNICQISQLC